jgi:hypothetical protein
MRLRKLRRLLALMLFGGILAGTGIGWSVGQARADGYISDTECAYINTYGASAVCATISQFPTEAGVMGVAQGIIQDGFTADSAVDIVNASVSEFCPSHWPLLQAIGAKARGETRRYLT